MLVVAYRKSLVKSAEASLRAGNIGLAEVGTNHFAAQHALFLSHPEVKSKMVALVHVMRDRVDFGAINHGRLVHYRTAPAGSEPEVLGILSDRLNSHPVSDIFFHGASVSGELTREAAKRFSAGVTALNPFREMNVASSFKEFDSFRGKEHRFAAAVGSALRNR
jgi:Tfp pilus assembly PilM family ATPase